MTASSQWDKYHAPFRARLHLPRQGRYIGSWSARHNNRNQWLKIFLGRTYRTTGIATQGRHDADQWVTAYYVYYSQDGVHMSRVTHWWDILKQVRSTRYVSVICRVFFSCEINFSNAFAICSKGS